MKARYNTTYTEDITKSENEDRKDYNTTYTEDITKSENEDRKDYNTTYTEDITNSENEDRKDVPRDKLSVLFAVESSVQVIMFPKKTLVYTSVSAFPLLSVSNILQTLWHTSIITTCIICKDFDQTTATISCISEWYLPVLL